MTPIWANAKNGYFIRRYACYSTREKASYPSLWLANARSYLLLAERFQVQHSASTQVVFYLFLASIVPVNGSTCTFKAPLCSSRKASPSQQSSLLLGSYLVYGTLLNNTHAAAKWVFAICSCFFCWQLGSRGPDVRGRCSFLLENASIEPFRGEIEGQNRWSPPWVISERGTSDLSSDNRYDRAVANQRESQEVFSRVEYSVYLLPIIGSKGQGVPIFGFHLLYTAFFFFFSSSGGLVKLKL